MSRKRLGEVLIDQGLIDEEDLKQALSYQEKSGYRLGTALVALRIIAEWQLTEALGKALRVEVLDLADVQPEDEALKRLPVELAERYDLIPISIDTKADRGLSLVVAMSDPLNRSNIQRIEHAAGCPIRPVLASLSAIQRAIRIHYHGAAPSQVWHETTELKASRTAANDASAIIRGATLKLLRKEAEELKHGRIPDQSHAGLDQDLAMQLRIYALIEVLEEKGLLEKNEFASALERLVSSQA